MIQEIPNQPPIEDIWQYTGKRLDGNLYILKAYKIIIHATGFK